MKFLALVLAAILIVASDAPTVDVNPRFSFEPAFIRVKLTIPPDASHAVYCLALVGDNYDRTSCAHLAGADEPRVRWHEYKAVPAGEYTAVLDVQTSTGENRQGRTTFKVMKRGIEEG